MRSRFLAGFAALGLFVGCASAAEPPPPTPPPQPPAQPAAPSDQPLTQQSSVDEVLDALDVRGKSMSDFTANVKLTETDAAIGNDSSRSGKVWLQRQGESDDRVRITFERKTTGQKTIEDKLEYKLDKGWLIERDYGRKLQVRRQMFRPGEKANLLKLGEGPFPLPLGQDKADVHRLFDAKKIEPANTDPPNAIHLQLTPKPDTEYANRFSTIDFWVDLSTRMPARSETLDRNGTTIKTADLSEIQLNSKLKDEDFELSQITEKDWRLEDKAFRE